MQRPPASGRAQGVADRSARASVRSEEADLRHQVDDLLRVQVGDVDRRRLELAERLGHALELDGRVERILQGVAGGQRGKDRGDGAETIAIFEVGKGYGRVAADRTDEWWRLGIALAGGALAAFTSPLPL